MDLLKQINNSTKLNEEELPRQLTRSQMLRIVHDVHAELKQEGTQDDEDTIREALGMYVENIAGLEFDDIRQSTLDNLFGLYQQKFLK